MNTIQDSCKRCGKCCNQGGPALHLQDLDLIRSGQIPLSALITLRKGELAHNPVVGGLAAIKVELVKLKGTGRDWNCCYFDTKENACTIYENRPITCRVLKCWDPEELLSMVEKDTVTRLDLMEEDDPLKNIIREHDRLYPCPDLKKLAEISPEIPEKEKRQLQKLVNEDLRYRTRIVKEFGLKLSHELFYFGRPVFQLLQPLGCRVTESVVGVELHWENNNQD